MHLLEQLGAARWQLRDQRLQVVQYGRQGEGKKQGGGAAHAQQQEKDRQPAAWDASVMMLIRMMPRIRGVRTTANRALT